MTQGISDLARRIAVNYPVHSDFVQRCLDDLGGDEALTRRWLDAQAPTGRYFTPGYVLETFPPPTTSNTQAC